MIFFGNGLTNDFTQLASRVKFSLAQCTFDLSGNLLSGILPFSVAQLENSTESCRLDGNTAGLCVPDDPDYADVLADMRSRMKEFQKRTDDPWILKWTYE